MLTEYVVDKQENSLFSGIACIGYEKGLAPFNVQFGIFVEIVS